MLHLFVCANDFIFKIVLKYNFNHYLYDTETKTERNMKDATQIQERFLNPIEAKIRACISQLRSAKGCLVSHNYIVQIGEAMTVTRTDGKADIEVTNYPSQWCEKGVKQIKAIGWENHLGEILEANVYNYKDWYKKELKTALDSRRLIRESFSAK